MNNKINKIVIASDNKGKLKEFEKLFDSLKIETLPQSLFNIQSAEETGLSFVENAIIKARHAAKVSGLPALSDDSGIEIDALNGAPGIYSARFSGIDATDERNNALLLEKLEKLDSEELRGARYRCVLVLMRHAADPSPIITEASWQGSILQSPRGAGGFGYDPLFWVPTHSCSAAELDPKEKNKISHRAKAMQKMLKRLEKLK
jgi:XTP/dITP diphosphohydrolase